MLLYSNSFAPSPRRVRIFLAEKGLEVPTVQVDLAKNEQFTPAYLAINPLGEVPALVLDDGQVLTESIAICRYLEAVHPEPNLFGRTPTERAQVDQWTYQIMFRLYEPVRQAFRNTHRFWADRLKQVPEFGNLAREAALAELARLDAVLARREYLAGDRYTFADLTALCAVDFGKPSDIRVTAALPNLQRWHTAVSARPSAKA
jgi:glutathione S-transferase